MWNKHIFIFIFRANRRAASSPWELASMCKQYHLLNKQASEKTALKVLHKLFFNGFGQYIYILNFGVCIFLFLCWICQLVGICNLWSCSNPIFFVLKWSYSHESLCYTDENYSTNKNYVFESFYVLNCIVLCAIFLHNFSEIVL